MVMMPTTITCAAYATPVMKEVSVPTVNTVLLSFAKDRQ
jgi:hypothetical protein